MSKAIVVNTYLEEDVYDDNEDIAGVVEWVLVWNVSYYRGDTDGPYRYGEGYETEFMYAYQDSVTPEGMPKQLFLLQSVAMDYDAFLVYVKKNGVYFDKDRHIDVANEKYYDNGDFGCDYCRGG